VKKTLLFIYIIVVVNLIVSKQTYGHSNTSPPTLLSESAIVIDAKTGTVIYEKKSDTKMYPASLTKIATAIYAIENGNVEEIVTVSKDARNTEGSKVYLEEGEQVTLMKLIQGLLINSGNDAGVAIAEQLSGSVEQFSSDINEYLTNVIGLKDTHFENPHGLFDPDHVTTAADLAKVTQYAINNELFRETFGTVELEWTGESWDTTLITHHQLMREITYEGITGGKTGFVRKSGFTLATTAERESLSLIVITMKTNFKSEMYNDTINLLDYAFDNFQTSSISKGTVFDVDKREYKTPENLYYTHTLDEEVKMEVRNDGILEIMNQDDIIIESFPLEEINIEIMKNDTIKDMDKIMKTDLWTSSFWQSDFIKNTPLVLILVITCIVIYLRVKKVSN